MQNFLNAVSKTVWGTPMLLLFIFTAVRYTIKSRLFQLRGVGTIVGSTFGKMFKEKQSGEISQFSAFCSVLGACIGTGNIVGVATAIYSGGAGTVFWMWLSALLSMMTAYAENHLGAIYRTKHKSGTVTGAYAYIEKATQTKVVPYFYALFSLMSALGMGNLTQSNSLADALKNSFGWSKITVGFVCTLLCGAVIFGGVKRIAKMQTFAVPLMTLFYLVLSLIVLVKFKSNIIPSVELIIKEAFTPKALNGYGMYKALRYGISRGVFSNEAGLGSSTLLHSQTDNRDGKVQGMWAMAEVFTDTIFMCTLTSLVILISTDYPHNTLYGAELSIAAYGTIGEIGKKGVGILTAVFAFTSLTSCSFYGEKSFEYLFGKKYTMGYRLIYTASVFLGCIGAPKTIWTLADICNGLMALPNLFAVNCLHKDVTYP